MTLAGPGSSGAANSLRGIVLPSRAALAAMTDGQVIQGDGAGALEVATPTPSVDGAAVSEDSALSFGGMAVTGGTLASVPNNTATEFLSVEVNDYDQTPAGTSGFCGVLFYCIRVKGSNGEQVETGQVSLSFEWSGSAAANANNNLQQQQRTTGTLAVSFSWDTTTGDDPTAFPVQVNINSNLTSPSNTITWLLITDYNTARITAA